MPKAFLMSGKKRKPVEVLFQTEENDKAQEDSDDQRCDSPKSIQYEEDPDNYHQRSPASFSPSEASAFSKIDRAEPGSISPNDGPPKNFYHPGLFPASLFPYAFAAFRPDNVPENMSQRARDQYLYSPLSVSAGQDDKTPTTSPEKNMYYYVDPRIPFTNYFLNLTRLLSNNNANQSCSAATPLTKASDECRGDERDETISPGSQKSSPVNYSTEEIKFEKSVGVSSPEKNFRDIKPLDKLHIPGYPDLHIPNPYTSLLHTAVQSSSLPFHSGGILHPTMMQISGGGFRRYNPEKPPPVKKYKCDVCGKAFSRSNTLVTHKRIHTGDKPFKCEICSRAFRQPGNLTRHRLTHTTVKPYVCPTCHKAFNRASNLHTHMRTHTPFKSFVCPFCCKGFHQKIDMKIHCYTHTGRPDAPQI